jgi:UDP-N-acetyl-D-mannosaminuronate dehydrogenase
MKVAVFGLGYVGVPNAMLLVRHDEVVVVTSGLFGAD